MEVGSIGFHDNAKVKRMLVVKDKDIVKRIEKTKEVMMVALICIITTTTNVYLIKGKISKSC